MNFLSIDLELEQPNTRSQTSDSFISEVKIIQLGCAVIDCNTFEVVEHKCYTLHYPHKLSDYIVKLTGISSKSVNESVITLKEAYEDMIKLKLKHSCNDHILQWGQGDLKAICTELRINSSFTSLNVKDFYKIYALKYKLKTRCGLVKAANNLGIKNFCIREEGGNNLGAHNALYDAALTAVVFGELFESLGVIY